MSDILEPSSSDLGDTPDSVRSYLEAVCAERDELWALCEGMAGKLRMIGEGKPENPCGDPWAFYMDLVVLAREALTDYEKHQQHPTGAKEE